MFGTISIIIFIIIIFILIFTGFRIYFEKKDSIEYEVELTTDESDEYFIYLPIYGGQGWYDNMKISEGNGNYSFENTEYGRAINISSNGNITLKSYVKYKCFGKGSSIDLREGDFNNHTYWIYFKSISNSSFKIHVNLQLRWYYDSTGKTNVLKINTDLQNGWNLYNGSYQIKS
jgi:hypothetical protein